MSFQAYIDNATAKTGKTLDDFRAAIATSGLAKHGEIVAFLKSEFGLGHGHANAITHEVLTPGEGKPANEKVADHFGGKKEKWRGVYEELIQQFGDGFGVNPAKSYIGLERKGKKFAIVQPTSDRLDLGIKLKGVVPTGRLEDAGTWNAMVTHRVRLSDPKEVDAEVLAWLKQAFEAA